MNFMKKWVIISSILVISVLLTSFAAASFWDNLWGKVTGQAITTTNLIGSYDFGSDASDSSENGNNGDLKNGASVSSGRLVLDGINDYAEISNEANFDITSQLTVSAWIKINSASGYDTIVAKRYVDAGNPWNAYIMDYNSGNKAVSLCVSTCINPGCQTCASAVGIPSTNSGWIYVTGTYDGSVIKTYVNGVLNKTVAKTGAIIVSDNPLRIGSSTGIIDFFSGEIDKVKVYSSALSASEIVEIYDSERNEFYPNACTESWNCGDWGACVNGVQNRVCTDASNCNNSSSSKPATSQSCSSTIPMTCTDSDGGKDYGIKGIAKTSNEKELVTFEALTDVCDGTTLKEGYCYSDVPEADYDYYECPYGCSDGACISYTCNDLLNDYYARKYFKGCGEQGYEYICFNKLNMEYQGCGPYLGAEEDYDDCTTYNANALSNVRCKTSLYVPSEECSDLVYKVKHAKNFKFNDIEFYLNYNSTYDVTYYINGEEENGMEYYASWSSYYDDRNNYISYSILSFENENLDLSGWLKESTDYQVCQVDSYWINGKENRVYICNWDALNNRQSLDSYQWKSRQLFWINGNLAFRVYIQTGESLNNEELIKLAQMRMNNFLNDLKNNQNKYADWSSFNIEYPLYSLLIQDFETCPSEIPVDTPSSCWSCKTEPVVCPEYGEQTMTCIDQCGGREERKETQSCSPGICSGCMVPKWFDSNYESKCIPYGFRFEQQTGWTIEEVTEYREDTDKEGLSVREAKREEGELDLDVYEDKTASFYWNKIGKTLELEVGETIDLSEYFNDEFGDNVKFTMTVDEIYYDSETYEDSYIMITFSMVGEYTYERQTADVFNAYCEIDGRIYEQKTPNEYNNDWASCQNSYECDSNLCSGGECIEINKMIAEAKGYKSLATQVLCKLADMFGISEYEQCVADYLG